MKFILTFFLTLALSISSFAQNGFYLFGYMENAPDFPIQVDVLVLTNTNVLVNNTFIVDGNPDFTAGWISLPDTSQVAAIEASFIDCDDAYTTSYFTADMFDNLVDIPIFLSYCGDTTNVVYGCTDPQAINYNPLATEDDGSCVYYTECELNEINVLISTQSWGNEISWAILKDGVFVASGDDYESNNYYDSSWCLEDGCYTFELYDTFGDGWNGGAFEVYNNGSLLATGTIENGNFGEVHFGINEDGCVPVIYGCTDPEALNYNPFATIDDGSCSYQYYAENDLCSDALPLFEGTNFIDNTNALQNENIWGECWGFGQGEGEQSSVWYTFTTPNVPASITIEAIYDGTNSLTDTQFGIFEECGGEMIYCDGNGGEGLMSKFDFECGELEMNTTYLLMIDGWNGDSGTCQLDYSVDTTCTTEILGCTDPEAINYNPLATQNDGSCEYETTCTEVMISLDGASNFEHDYIISSTDGYFSAGFYPGSDFIIEDCLPDGCYDIYFGSDDPLYQVYFTLFIDDEMIAGGLINSTNSGSFIIGAGCDSTGDIYGCTDPNAINFDPNATIDDGSCEYVSNCDLNEVEVIIQGGSWPGEVSWQILNSDSAIVATGNGYSDNIEYISEHCLADGCYSFLMLDSYGDGWNGASFQVILDGLLLANGTFNGGFYEVVNFGVNEDGCSDPAPVFGCTDPQAINYNPSATEDDGSCEYLEPCDSNEIQVVIQGGSWSNEVSWNLSNSENVVVASGGGYSENIEYISYHCLEDGCYSFEMFDSYGDGWNGASFQVILDGYTLASGTIADGEYGVVNFGINEDGCGDSTPIFGCTDPQAINYNPDATIDDGSCIYQFDCSIDFLVIPDTTGDEIIWIIPTQNILSAVSVLWDFGDGTTSTELFPSHEYVGDGPFTLCVTATFASPDGSTCSITYCVELSGEMVGGPGFGAGNGFTINIINGNIATGIDEADVVTELTLWPNPTSDQLNIKYNSSTSDIQSATIMDITGKVVIQKQIGASTGEVQNVIDVKSLPSGIYLLRLGSGDYSQTKKFVISK